MPGSPSPDTSSAAPTMQRGQPDTANNTLSISHGSRNGTISPAPTTRGSVFSLPHTAETEITQPDENAGHVQQRAQSAPDRDTSRQIDIPESEPLATPLGQPLPEIVTGDGPELYSDPTSIAQEARSSLQEHNVDEVMISESQTPSALVRCLSQNVPLRDKLLLDQTGLDQERQKLDDAQRYLEESQQNLMQLLEDSVRRLVTGDEQSSIEELFETYKADSDVWKLQSGKVKQLDVEIRNQEYELYKSDQGLLKTIREAYPTLPQLEPCTPEELPNLDQIAVDSSPAPMTPSALNAYWDALGERDALKDDLFDLDQEHQHEAAELDRYLERDEPPPKPMEEFEREFEHKRHSLTEQIVAIDARIEELQQQCLSNNINPYIPRKTPSMSSSPEGEANDAMPYVAIPASRPAAQSEPAQLRQSLQFGQPLHRDPTQSENLPEVSFSERIQQWLSDPENRPDDLIGNGAIPIANQRTQVKKFNPAAF